MWQRHFCVVCLTEPIYKVSLFVILGPCLYCSCCHVIKSPNQCLETYCFCSVSYYYYYVTPNAVGWRIAILRFFFTIIIIIILPHIFVRSISQRCLDQTLWNLVGISYAMWKCAFKEFIFSKWLSLAKMLKNWKTQKWS